MNLSVIDDAVLDFPLPLSLRERVLNSIEKSEQNGFRTLLYWGHQEVTKATAIIDSERPNDHLPELPSPMLRDYPWPGLYKPFDHQKTTASFLSVRRRAFCFNEAGTGKTSATIWAADYLMTIGAVRRVLVICPLSIMYSAWQQDIFKTTMHRSCAVAHGDQDKRRKIINGSYDFVIINYDGVTSMRDAIIAKNFDLIIVDEANSYKNASSKRWRSLATIITPDTWLWMMTGTPASQSPEDAFGLAKLISPGRVPKFSTAWRDKVMYQASRFRWIPRNESKSLVYAALQPAVRFTKAECLDLPEITHQTREVMLTPQALHYYKKLKSQLLIETSGESVSAVNAAASLNKLLQISGGAVYTDEHNVIEFDIAPRLNALKEVLDETAHKVVIFVPYTHTIDIVAKHLSDNGITNEIIQGSVSAGKRGDIFRRFQTEKDPRTLVIQPQAASHGVTLTAADTVVFWSPVMSVETYLQCIARIDRVGQKNRMTVVHLQGSDVERRVYTMLYSKVDHHQKLVDLYKQEMGI
jgi:SNF2 family DNA or RNA helicase